MSFRTAYGNTHSENGWRMCDRNECDIVRIKDFLFMDTAPIRKGDAHTILGAWARWYDQNVEEISSPVWGWSPENDVKNSNHLSGTALDINAPKYPWGSRVMPPSKINKVREGLELFQGTVFWGADWDRADEMHYQMAFLEFDSRNAAFAKKLREGYLGIWSPGSSPAPGTGGTIMSWLTEKYENFKKTPNMSYKDWAWWLDKNVSDIKDQLVGVDFGGWAILGKSKINPKRDNTLVEAVAELRSDIQYIRAAVDRIENNVTPE